MAQQAVTWDKLIVGESYKLAHGKRMGLVVIKYLASGSNQAEPAYPIISFRQDGKQYTYEPTINTRFIHVDTVSGDVKDTIPSSLPAPPPPIPYVYGTVNVYAKPRGRITTSSGDVYTLTRDTYINNAWTSPIHKENIAENITKPIFMNNIIRYDEPDPYEQTRAIHEAYQERRGGRPVGGRKAAPRKGSYEARTVEELKKLAVSRHIPVTGLNKPEIIAKLRGKR
jgi:hypothetical protein